MKHRLGFGRKTVIWISAAVLCVLAIVSTALFVSAQGEENVLVTSYTYENLNEYFKRAELTVQSAAGGYSAGDPLDKTLDMLFEFVFDDSALWNKSEEIINSCPDFPKQRNLSNEEWLVLIRRWLADNPDACDAITFTTRVRDNNGLIQLADESGIVHSDSGEEIGTFSIVNGQLTVYVEPVAYFMEDVDFTLELKARVSVYGGSEDSYEIVVNDKGQVESEVLGAWDAKQKELPVPDYTITKTGPEKTDSPFVTYTINIAANEGENLAGKKMVELIPAGLTLADARLSINGGAEQNVYSQMQDGVYMFDENDASAISASFSVTLSLSEEKTREFYSGGINETFRNTAQLVGSEPDKPLAQSNTVATTMKSSFIEKKGRAVNSEETRYEWTVDIRTSLPNMKCGYLIDRLSADDHMYDFSKGITVRTEDGVYYITAENIIESQSWQGVWEALDAEAMYAGGSGLDTRFFNPPKAYFYYVETDKENIFASVDGHACKSDCYLVIPYYGLQGGAYETKKVTVVYETERNMHTLSSADYWAFVEDYLSSGGTDFSRQQSNDVTFVWENQGGEGIGDDIIPENVDYGKEVESDPAVLIKRGEYYNARTMTASWELDADKLGFEADDAVITDVLDPNVYDLSTLRVKMTVNDLLAQTSGEQTEMAIIPAAKIPAEPTEPETPAEPENSAEPESSAEPVEPAEPETPEEPTSPECFLDASSGTLTIALGDIPGGCSYSFVIEAKVISPELMSAQSQSQTVRNTATINYVLNGESREYSTDALLTVPNTLLSKSAVGEYNCDERTHTWKLTVGKDGLDIRGGVITDTIPEGFEYVPGSVIVSPAGLAVTDTLSADGREVYFNLGESVQQQYSITFKTRATQQWINDNLVYSGADGEKAEEKTIAVFNSAVLNGTVNGSEIRDANGDPGAKAHAENTAPILPVAKYGVYSEAEGAIDWTVELNHVHYSIGGKHLVEALSTELELVPDSVRITAGDGSDVSYEVTEKDDTGFVISFNDLDAAGEPNTNSYTIEFRTLLTADIVGKDVSNRVELFDETGRRMSESGYSDGGYDGSYVPENDSRAHLRPNLHIHKLSGNSVETTWGVYSDENSLSLEGAEFTLTAYDFTVENGVVTLGEAQYSKKDYTDSTGDVYFGNLKTTDDGGNRLLFTLKETKAPTGYVTDGKTRFVYFRRDSDDRLGGELTEIIDSAGNSLASGEDIKTSFFFIKDTELSGGWKRLECDFTNSPDVNTLVISKEKLDWSTYGIDPQFIPAAEGVKFTVKQKGVFQLRQQTFTTDSTGTATIADLDPGTYTVTESDQPYGMEPVQFELAVRCISEENNQWEYKINGKTVVVDESGVFRYVLKNDAALTSISLTKQVAYEIHNYGNEDFTAKNARFRIVSVTPDGRGGVPDGRIDMTATVSGCTAAFEKLPVGNYRIYEINSSAPGYRVSDYEGETLIFDAAITQNSDGSLAKTLTPAQNDSSIVRCTGSGTVINVPIKGTLTFQKNSCSSLVTSLNGQPLSGVEFRLCRRHLLSNGYSKWASDYYTAFSDENGTVTFTGVEYGDYYLIERTAAEGYDKKTGDLVIVSKNSFVISEAADGTHSFTYTAPASDIVTNTLHTEKLTFTKQDIEGNPLSGVTFDIFRRGSSAVTGGDGTGFKAAVAATENRYFSYGLLESVTTDENGAVPQFTLPYGDYLFVERTQGADDIYSLKDDSSNVALLVRVKNGSTTVRKYSSGSPLPFENGCYTVDTSAQGWGTEASNAKDGATGVNSFNVVNNRKYAYIQLKKTAADLHSDGTAVDYESYPLSGKTFVISRNGVDYFTVKTQADGTLAIPADGAYSGKHLWYGDYTIRETGAPTGYTHPMPETAFRIDDSTAGDGGTIRFSYNGDKVWLSWDNGESWHTADGAAATAENAPDGNFVNFLERSTFSVKKLGADKKALPGAVFELYVGNVKVAGFTDNNDGSYTLSPTGENDKNGVPYIIDGNRLLKGYKYTLKEVGAPAGYLLSDNCIVEVQKDNVIKKTTTSTSVGSYSLKNNVLIVTDELILCDLELGKVFTGTQSPIENTVFELIRKGETKPFAEKTTNADGHITFEDIPEGEYILRESFEKSVEAGIADYVHIGDREYLVRVAAQQPDCKKSVLTLDGKAVAEGTVFTVENDRMNASVELTKTDAADSAVLPGVKFRLEKLTDNGYVPVYRNNNGGTFITDGSGKIKVTDLERGSYRLTETETLDGYRTDPMLILTFDVANADHGTLRTVRAGETWFRVISGGGLLTANGIENTRIPGTLTLTKLDGADGAPLNGVEFVLVRNGKEEFTLRSGYKYSSPDDAKPKKTNDGVLSVEGLEWGSYVLRETTPLRGYCFGERNEWEYVIGRRNDGKAYLEWNTGEIKNHKNEIRLVKTDALTGAVLENAEYTVTCTADPSDTFTMITDSSGRAVLTGSLMAGRTYTLTEAEAPYGYKKSGETVTFTMGGDGKAYINSKASADNTFRFEDQPKLGTVVFEKRISFAGLTAVDGAPLQGAEFELRRVLGGKELTKGDKGYAERTAVSDENGRVVFTDVPFGNYNLYEKSAPSGFIKPDGGSTAAEVLSAELTVTEDGFTADYSGDALTNELISNTLGLIKKEKREGAMSGVKFSVYRRGTRVVETDGSGFTAAPDSSVNSYYRYLPCPELTTNGSGLIKTKLPYGDYLLVEDTAKLGLVDEASYVSVLVQVRQNGVTATVRAAATQLTALRDGYRVSMADGWSYPEKENGSFVIENEKKLALIDLKKVAGNVTDGGKTVSFEDSPISSVRFTVTRKGETEPLFTVLTGSDGHLITDKNGESYSGKYLHCGEYILAEAGTDISCEFAVTDYAPNLCTYWFAYDGKNVTCTVDPDAARRGSFINIVERSPITVKVADSLNDEVFPEEAEFEVYSKNNPETPAAKISADKNGECHIVDGKASDESSIPYCVDGKLLPGEYIISPKTVPEGYLTPTDRLLTVSGSGEVTVSGEDTPSDSDVTVTLDRIIHDISLRKSYDGEKYADMQADEILPDAVAKTTFIKGLTFVLCNENGVPLLDGDIPAPITAVTDEQGVAVFRNVEEGTYVIREDVRRSIMSGVADDVYLDSAKQVKVTVRANEIRNSAEVVQILDDGSAVPVNGNILVKDAKIAARVRLFKYSSDSGEPLAGVSFKLDRAPSGSKNYQPYRTALTGADGVILFENLPRGNYMLSEIGTLSGYSAVNFPEITFEIENKVYNEVLEVRKGQSWFTTEAGAASVTESGIANTPVSLQTSGPEKNYPETRVIQSESPKTTQTTQGSILKTATYSANDRLPSVVSVITKTASSAGSRLMNNSEKTNVPTTTKQDNSLVGNQQQINTLTDAKQNNRLTTGGKQNTNSLTTGGKQNNSQNPGGRQEISLIVDGDRPNPNTGSGTDVRLCLELIGLSLSAALILLPKLRRRIRG